MIVTLDMPTSEIRFTDADTLHGAMKLNKALSFSIKRYSGMGPMTFQKVSLFENVNESGGHFRTGLWNRIQTLAPLIGLPVEKVVDHRIMPRIQSVMLKGVSLREYQKKAVEEVLAHDMGVLYAATGSGKTHMAAGMIGMRGVRTLFLVHTKDLLYQAKDRIQELLKTKVGIIGDGEHDLQPITIATVQTLHKRIQEGMIKELRDKFDMIIQDETHHIPASTFYEVTGYFGCRYVYGLSATPYRLDGADLYIEAAAGPIVSRVSASDLIEQGVLSKPIIRFIPINGQTSYSNAPRFAIVKKYIVENEARNKEIAGLAKRYSDDGRIVLIAVTQIKHGQNIQKFIPEARILNGTDDSATRKKTLEQLRAREIKVIISTLMKEGVDVPILDVAINASGGTDTMQLVGRVLRKADGKNSATIVDFIDNQHVTLQRNSLARMRRLQKESQFEVITG